MVRATNQIEVYLEAGQKRVFASAIDWPGWCRSGHDETSALWALFEYGPRYARVVRPARLGFQVPRDISFFVVKERIKGNATTDFGAPGLAPSSDAEPVDAAELQRLQEFLRTCCRAFDSTIAAVTGKTLQSGPRGGGRQLDGMIEHVLGANQGYLSQVGWKFKRDETGELDQQLEQTQQAMLDALAASARGEIPAKGPRGGLRWSARHFVRRGAWHILDHVWEIEDRLSSQ